VFFAVFFSPSSLCLTFGIFKYETVCENVNKTRNVHCWAYSVKDADVTIGDRKRAKCR
jgi:hypothetical protein